MNRPDIITIGVYGYTEEAFFQALQSARVDTFVDVRRRRGVRGSEYAFANSQRLQGRLEEMGIRYLYALDLAPTNAIRNAQYAIDKESGTAKRQRSTLSPAFIDAYTSDILATADLDSFKASLPEDAAVVALFCVERVPEACHRSLLAARLATDYGLSVAHLQPDS